MTLSDALGMIQLFGSQKESNDIDFINKGYLSSIGKFFCKKKCLIVDKDQPDKLLELL